MHFFGSLNSVNKMYCNQNQMTRAYRIYTAFQKCNQSIQSAGCMMNNEAGGRNKTMLQRKYTSFTSVSFQVKNNNLFKFFCTSKEIPVSCLTWTFYSGVSVSADQLLSLMGTLISSTLSRDLSGIKIIWDRTPLSSKNLSQPENIRLSRFQRKINL